MFNGNYPRYWDDALTDWYEESGFGGAELGDSGIDILTARLEIDFKAAATLGDTLETTIQIERWGTSSMTIGVTSRRLSDDVVCVEGKEVIVYVDPENFRPTPVPDFIKQGLAGNLDDVK